MKKLFIVTLALLTFGSQQQVQAAKDKKQKKELKWDWDGKTFSGNAEIDTYLKKIDTLYNKVNTYKDDIESYTMAPPTQFTLDDGKTYEICYMTNKDGQLVTRGTVNWQCVQAIMQGTNIVLDMTNAGLLSAGAALALPNLGLKALSFSKYVKGGPAVISAGTKAIKDVRKKWIKNSQRWKEVKQDAVSNAKSLKIPGMTDALAEKLDKCVYIKEVKVTAETKEEAKDENLVVADAKTLFEDFEKITIATEVAGQTAEDLKGGEQFMNGSDDDLDD